MVVIISHFSPENHRKISVRETKLISTSVKIYSKSIGKEMSKNTFTTTTRLPSWYASLVGHSLQ